MKWVACRQPWFRENTVQTLLHGDIWRFDFSSPEPTLMSFLSTDNAYFPFILLFSTFCNLLQKLHNISCMNFVKQNQ